jgi:hypothetical protein
MLYIMENCEEDFVLQWWFLPEDFVETLHQFFREKYAALPKNSRN